MLIGNRDASLDSGDCYVTACDVFTSKLHTWLDLQDDSSSIILQVDVVTSSSRRRHVVERDKQHPMTSHLSDSRVLRGSGPLRTAPHPPDSVTTLPELFQHHAKSQPNAIALSCRTDGESLDRLTYAEADAIATSIAARITQLLPTRDANDDEQAVVIAVWLEKGLDLILSILAITYSGATWLPFDQDVPEERAAVCIQDASARMIVCDNAHIDRARNVQGRVSGSRTADEETPLQICTYEELLNGSRTAASTVSQTCLRGPRPQDAAYLIYTSGTTGTPKGIAIPHSAALVFSLSEREVLQTTSKDIVWNGFSPAFDMMVEEMWVTIAGGGHLTVGTRSECRDVSGLPMIWEARGVTVVNAVPTLIGIMGISQVDSNASMLPSCVRLINLGGEACPPALVKRLARDGLTITNTYGPTETTVSATWDELQPDKPVTIGRPLPSYHAILLPISEDGSKAPLEPLKIAAGVEGELAIGGPCVGLGYVGREELTAEKFIPHPLIPGSGEKVYRTGDRVRLQEDLKIVFVGRIDTQIKHRGFRIELGEIESLVSGHPDVQTAAVILANANSDEARLEAFVTVRAEADRDTASIRQLCSRNLPAYMQPEKVYFLDADEMPRLPSGKINSKALHVISESRAAEFAESSQAQINSQESNADHDPDSPLGMLLNALSTVFPLAGPIKPDADFFDDLGGHSLTAAILISRLRKARDTYGLTPFASIGLPDIYEERTPANIAARFVSCDDFEKDYESVDETDGTGPSTGEHLPVSQTRFILCGIAQLVPLLFLFFMGSIEILVPYLLFSYILQIGNIGYALLAAYGVFMVFMPCLTMIAVFGKWLVLGKAKEGEYPLYGVYYFRWWTAERLAAFANTKTFSESALYSFFLRSMGAKVGKFCHLGAMEVGACCDLVEIG